MDYARDVQRIREERDAGSLSAAEARRLLAEAMAARDNEIRRLHAAGIKPRPISEAVGCSVTMVYELLDPERHQRWNERRRLHWRARATGGAA